MATLTHRETGFFILDPQHPHFPPHYRPDPSGRRQALSSLILSISGFRKVFAADGNETSTNPHLNQGDRELVFGMGVTFARILQQKTGTATPCVALGMDTRFTGPAMAEILLYALSSCGCRIHFLFILPIPELLAYVRANPSIDGFMYVSASHNPIGHNGVKFGLRAGVLGGEDASSLIQQFQALLQNDREMENLFQNASSLPPSLLEELCASIDRWKEASEEAYKAFVYRMVTGTEDPDQQQQILQLLRQNIQQEGCGIVIDYNGSARTLGIDRDILSDLGITLYELNHTPRAFAHGILPEGDALLPCQKALEEYRGKDAHVRFGYVPDCDGDRGNLVYFDSGQSSGEGKGARVLDAQQVFALACVSELAYHHWRNRLYSGHRPGEEVGSLGSMSSLESSSTSSIASRLAVVVNDATSLRIERIASRLATRVFRAEVGEANVVGLTKKLIQEGWQVPIYGEGSNGGNITYPGEVRDPLATVFSILKLLYLSPSKSPHWIPPASPVSIPPFASPFQLWCEAAGVPERYSPFPELSSILATLPAFTTLPVSAKEAVFPLRCTNLPRLKATYEQVFWRDWQSRKEYLREHLGIESWEEINYEGLEERHGTGPSFRRGGEKGGLKILFKDSEGKGKAFLWMRKSGTEPVFRILVDLEGTNKDSRDSFTYLLSWHRSMLQDADERCMEKKKPEALDIIYYFSALIGMQVEDERIHQYMETLALKEDLWPSLLASYSDKRRRDANSLYLSVPPQGLQLLLDPSGFIQTIFLYTISQEGFAPFPKSLAPSIAFPSTRPELQTLLGEPIKSGKTQEGFLSEREEVWDTFRYLDVKIHAGYRSRDGQITRLTFSRFTEE